MSLIFDAFRATSINSKIEITFAIETDGIEIKLLPEKLRIVSCLACVDGVMDASGRFGNTREA